MALFLLPAATGTIRFETLDTAQEFDKTGKHGYARRAWLRSVLCARYGGRHHVGLRAAQPEEANRDAQRVEPKQQGDRPLTDEHDDKAGHQDLDEMAEVPATAQVRSTSSHCVKYVPSAKGM